ncbi:hypothetical protein K7432_018257 [Basidiobolus ranarum]|uniref:Uncharacterized protein n=1 Tax=Basidiobolus ranarum TaxID=34480 RepID=A0ABR2VK17_9FUNG
MPPKPKQDPTTPERKTLDCFDKSAKKIACPNCGNKGTIRKNGRAGKLRKLTFVCKCTKNVGITLMEDMLGKLRTPSPQVLSPSQFLNRLASPSAPAPRRASSSVSLDTPSPSTRKSPFVPESVSPMLPESPEILEDISSTAPPKVFSSNEDILQKFLAIEKRLTSLESNNTALSIENKRLEAQCKRLKNEVHSAMKAAQDALQKASQECSCHSASTNLNIPKIPVPAPSLEPKKSYSSVLLQQPVSCTSSHEFPSLPPVLEPAPALVADILPEVVAASTSIPATYAGKILTRIMNTSKATSNAQKDPRHLNAETTIPENQSSLTTVPHQKRTYKPPANLPPVSTWTVLLQYSAL